MDSSVTMRYIYRQLREFIQSSHRGGDQRCDSPCGPRRSARRTDSMRAPDSSSLTLRFPFQSRFLLFQWRVPLVGLLLFASISCSRPSPEPFIAQLKSFQSGEREKAAGKLLKYGDEVVPRLIEEADSEYTRVRFEVVRLLGRIRDPRAVPTLIRVLDDKSSKVAALAAWGLGELKAPEAVPHLLRYQKEVSTDLRAEVIRGLGLCYAGPDTVSIADADSAYAAIIRAFDDAETKVRIAALQASHEYGYRDAVLHLIRRSRDQTAEVRYVAVQALGQVAIGRTRRSNGPVDAQMRHNIIQALMLSLFEPTQSIRTKAVRALEMIGAPEAASQLEKLRETGSEEDRREAGRVLGNLREAQATAAKSNG